jgi:hypothetical protein
MLARGAAFFELTAPLVPSHRHGATRCDKSRTSCSRQRHRTSPGSNLRGTHYFMSAWLFVLRLPEHLELVRVPGRPAAILRRVGARAASTVDGRVAAVHAPDDGVVLPAVDEGVEVDALGPGARDGPKRRGRRRRTDRRRCRPRRADVAHAPVAQVAVLTRKRSRPRRARCTAFAGRGHRAACAQARRVSLRDDPAGTRLRSSDSNGAIAEPVVEAQRSAAHDPRRSAARNAPSISPSAHPRPKNRGLVEVFHG